MVKRSQNFKLALVLGAWWLMLAPTVSFAQAGPTSFNISGTLYDASGNMIAQTGVNFQVEILAITTSPVQECVLYSELHSNEDLSHTKGGFSLQVGSGTSRQNFLETSSELSSKIFENYGASGAFTGCTGITFGPGAQRFVRISYDIGGGLIAMTPNVPIDAASYSTVAETLQGKRPEDFLQVHNDNSSVFLDQTNLEFPYSATNWPKFQALLNGTSSQYIPSTPGSTVNFNGQTLTNIATPVAGTDATNKNYVDGSIGGKTADLTGVGPATGDGDTLIWDQGANKWKVGPVSDDTKLPLLGGTMAGPITMGGFDLYNTGHITMGTQRLLNLGTFTSLQEGALTLGTSDKGKILYNTDLGEIRVWNGSAFSGTSPVTSVNGKTGAVSLNVMDIYMAGTAGLWDVGTAPKNVVQLDNDGHLPAVDGSALTNINGASIDGSTLTNVNAVRLQGVAVSATPPMGGYVLQYNSTSTQWESVAIPSAPVSSVAGRTGDVTLDVSDIQSATGKYFAYQPNGTACVDGEILKWNSTRWECAADSTNTGDITDVNAGNGLLGGGTSGSVTLSVNVGTSPNQIVQLDSNAFLPALDGNLLTNLNAVRLQGFPLAATTPTTGNFIGWNATTSQWEPMGAAASGLITQITAGTGATGGGTTGDVTIGVDVGTGPSQIVQLDSSSRLPAVDGSALTNINGASIDGSTLTNVNAVRIQGVAVSATAPSGAEVLKFNSTSNQWESAAIPSAPVSSVAGRIGDVTLDVSDIQSASGKYFTYQPDGTACADGEILKWNSTRWECAADSTNTGDITDVNAGNGLLGGGTSGSVTLSVNVGTSPNQLVQLDSNAFLPALDGNLLTNLNAIRLQTYPISSATPNSGQVLTWNGTTSVWEPQTSVATSTINSITAGAGATGGGTTGDVTIGVNVGTSANQIVQLDSSSHLPAVDGSALTNLNGAAIDGSTLTNVNAVRLQGVAVSSTPPTGGYVLQYNSTSTQWESVAIPSAPVSSVAGRTGDVTLDVSDIQSATGKYFTYQPNGTACADGEILKWNSTRWECAADSSNTGDITDVNAGNGLLGGGTSGSVTLSVNVGTSANQIVQLDSLGHLPALDGSALTNINGSSIDGSTLTNVNAVRLQSRAISSTPPNDNEVLTWNNTTLTWEPRATSTTGITELTGDVLAAGTGSVAATISENAITSAKINNTGNTQNRLLITDSTSGTLVTYKTCSLNEILKWNATGWECADDVGSVSGWVNGGNTFGANSTLGNTDGFDLSLITANITRMTIGSTGDVAVGTPNGNGYKFTVGGNAIIGDATSTTYNATPVLSVVGANTSTALPVTMNIYDTSSMAQGVGGGIGFMGNDGSTDRTFAVIHGGKENSSSGNYNGMLAFLTRADGGANPVEHMRIDSSGNVGIGTTSPTTKLEVNGTINATAMTINGVPVSAGTGDNLGDHTATQNLDLSTFQLVGNGGSNGVSISSGGNVGIGTTSPDAPLTITKNGVNWGGNLTGVGAFTDSTYTKGVLLGYDSTGTNVAIVAADTSGSSASSLAFRTANSSGSIIERMRIDGAGNIGIGTTNPLAILDLTATGTNSAVIVPRATAGNRPTTAVNGMIRYNTDTNKFEAYENSVWSNMISSVTSPWSVSGSDIYNSNSGNVGIGTTNPLVPLDVMGDLYTRGSSQIKMKNSGNADRVVLSNNGGTFGGMALFNNSDVKTVEILGTGNSFINSGNVGIGTTAPQAILDVTATGTSSAVIVPRATAANRPTTAVNGMIRYNTDTNKFEAYQNSAWTNMISSTTGMVTGTGTANYMPMWSSSSALTDSPVVVSGGNVGVGTTSPSAKLDVAGSILMEGGALTLDNGAADGPNIIMKSNGFSDWNVDNFSGSLRVYYGATEQFRFYNNGGISVGNTYALITSPNDGAIFEGNVGIGTTNPAQLLEIAGNVNVSSQTSRTTASSRGQLSLSSTYVQTQASAVTVDWSNGNIQEVNSFVCNGTHTITMTNVRDGAAYSLLLSGTAAHSGVCVFSASGFTFKTSGGNVAPTASKDVLFTFAVINNTIVYSMMDNLQ